MAILVVEDEAGIVAFVKRGFEAAGYAVLDTGDGATGLALAQRNDVDLVVLDGEAWPTGGLGLAKQMKDELRDCPPVLVLIARRPDAWLATWSQADGVVPHPIDAPELIAVAGDLLRRREAGEPVRRALH